MKHVCDTAERYKKWVEKEIEVNAQIYAKCQDDLFMFKDQSRRIRAVLRIPRLCREFHDMITIDKMSEYQSLE